MRCARSAEADAVTGEGPSPRGGRVGAGGGDRRPTGELPRFGHRRHAIAYLGGLDAAPIDESAPPVEILKRLPSLAVAASRDNLSQFPTAAARLPNCASRRRPGTTHRPASRSYRSIQRSRGRVTRRSRLKRSGPALRRQRFARRALRCGRCARNAMRDDLRGGTTAAGKRSAPGSCKTSRAAAAKIEVMHVRRSTGAGARPGSRESTRAWRRGSREDRTRAGAHAATRTARRGAGAPRSVAVLTGDATAGSRSRARGAGRAADPLRDAAGVTRGTRGRPRQGDRRTHRAAGTP